VRREGSGGRSFIETGEGIVVYPPRASGDRDRWRAVWYEAGQRRQCEASGEDRMAAKLRRVTERLASGADLAGVTSAAAKPVRNRGDKICSCVINYTYTPYNCNGGKAFPSGECCYYITGCGNDSHACLAHSGCGNFTRCG
jgi:hypothetical protein